MKAASTQIEIKSFLAYARKHTYNQDHGAKQVTYFFQLVDRGATLKLT
jgi:hypothetical protein